MGLIRFSQFFKQPWPDSGNKTQIYLIAYQKASEEKENLKRLLFPFLNGAELKIDIKSEKSFNDKTLRKNSNEIHDVLRCAILTKTQAETKRIAEQIKNNANVLEIDYKSRQNEIGYKGSYHIKINLNGLICEIQVMPKTLWDYKEVMHKNYEKTRLGEKLDDSVKRFSKMVYNTARKSIPKYKY